MRPRDFAYLLGLFAVGIVMAALLGRAGAHWWSIWIFNFILGWNFRDILKLFGIRMP